MILHKMTDQELVRLTALTGWQIPLVAEQTGLPQSMVADVLLVSTYLLVREQGTTVIPFDQYIHSHCHRVASDLKVSYFDVQLIFGAQVEMLVTGPERGQPPPKEKLQ